MRAIKFSEWDELQKMVEAIGMLSENRDANIKRIKAALEKHGIEILDGLSDDVLEDIVLKLTAKSPTQNAGDRLDEMIDYLFGDLSEVPAQLTKTGKTKMSKGEVVLDSSSAQYKSTILGRIGSQARLNLLRETLRKALKKSSASTAEKIRYLYRLGQASSLINISAFMKPQIFTDMLSFLGPNLSGTVAKDVYSVLAPLAPSGLGPVEIWLMLHIKDCTLEGGGAGAAGDINTLDGQNPIEIKGADGVMTFGNPTYRGTGWSLALEIAQKELGMKKLGAKDWTSFMSGKGSTIRTKLAAHKNGEDICLKMMRAYMDPGTFDDNDVKKYANKFWNKGKYASQSDFEMFHLKMTAYGYWKYKDYKSGGNSFKAIMFIDKKSGKTAIISYSSKGAPKLPAGVSPSGINWINGYTNYADGACGIKY